MNAADACATKCLCAVRIHRFLAQSTFLERFLDSACHFGPCGQDQGNLHLPFPRYQVYRPVHGCPDQTENHSLRCLIVPITGAARGVRRLECLRGIDLSGRPGGKSLSSGVMGVLFRGVIGVCSRIMAGLGMGQEAIRVMLYVAACG
jgi:hypothetical protein